MNASHKKATKAPAVGATRELALRLVPLAASVLMALRAGAAESPALRLEAAFYEEVAAGDVDRAIRGYREVIADENAPSAVLARAHLRLGICYQTLGEARLARAALETVVEMYAQHVETARAAERYLGRGAAEDPARFMPSDVMLYVEFVDPAEQVAGISALLEGTSFQNPVDYTVSLLSRKGSERPSGPAPDSVAPAAAFLNEGFLREVQKIEGLALAIPGERRDDGEFLAVLLPGESDILRGLVQMLLSLSRAEGIGLVKDVPLLRVPPETGDASAGPDAWLHVALGPSAVIVGRPRSLVEQAVERSASAGPSLREDPDFRRAQAARSGSFLFSYLGRDRVLGAFLAAAPPAERARLQRAADALGWGRLRALSVTASHVPTGDSLRVTLRARLDTRDSEAWAALRTPPLDPVVLRAVPREAIGFLAVAFDDEPPRERAASVLSGRLEAAFGLGSNPAWLQLLAAVRSDTVVEAFREVEALAVGVGPAELLPAPLRSFAVLHLRDPARGTAVLERLLAELLQKATGNAASRTFQSEDLVLNGRSEAVRYVEPWPGVRLRYLRVGDAVVVAFSPGNLARAVSATVSQEGGPAPGLPAQSRKALFLRPAEIVRTRTGEAELAPELVVVLSAIERAFVATREGRESFSLDVIVPDATPAAKALLERVAERLGGR